MEKNLSSRLAEARSPFLRHGATQPVDWWPWGEEAFARARAEDKPVLLDIGAVWCHWCHVMDEESYEDTATAQLINELFVPVKVDRDEQPDVDARYQRAVQILTGQGGWPLTAFLTPDGEVYYAGTYFPPDDRYDRPSFPRVLREVARVWREERERALDAARGIRSRLEEYGGVETQKGEPSADLIAATLEELAQTFDFRHGGFGRAPKFPNAGALDLLLDEWLENGTAWAKQIVSETMAAMGRGGIYDQLGGGFHRYAVDARWIVPHFEKMAYDNGVLLDSYARAFAALGTPLLADVADGILYHYRDVAPELVARGGFPASQDADFSPGDDGGYWTWTEREIEDALGDARLARAAKLYYGLDDAGGSMQHDPSRHVLFRARDLEELAAQLDIDTTEASSIVDEVKAILKAVRDGRPRPYVDETLYSGWVALVAAGHLATARFMERSEAAETGLAALDRIWNEGYDPALGVQHRVGDPASGEFLDDHAYIAAALVDAFELTQSAEPLERAQTLVRMMVDRFRDDSGAFRDRPRDAASAVRALDSPHLPITDSPSPSGNGMVALTLLRLHAITHEERYRELGLSVLRAFAGSVPRLASAAATYVKALAWATKPITSVVVVDGETPATSELLRAALRHCRPRTVVRWFAPGVVEVEKVAPELRVLVGASSPRAYVCAGQTCAAPVADAAALVELLHDFRG